MTRRFERSKKLGMDRNLVEKTKGLQQVTCGLILGYYLFIRQKKKKKASIVLSCVWHFSLLFHFILKSPVPPALRRNYEVSFL